MAFTRDPNCLTPLMANKTLPSGIVSSSSEFSRYLDFFAFNGILDYGWIASGQTPPVKGWLGYEFPTPQISNYYNIYSEVAYGVERAPKNWTFEGWNGLIWTVLDTQSNVTGWVEGTKKTFAFQNTTSYKKYRLNVTANNGDTYLSIGELEICSNADSPKALPKRFFAWVGGV